MTKSKGPVVFYSWQSDLPDKTNRTLVREALQRACKDLSADLEDAPPRVDSDTQDVPGSPDIAATIFAKIDAADVFVADVSIIGITTRQGGEPRATPNPNVMIELGYAKRGLGLDRILMVANTAFGKVEGLPFDLKTKRVRGYECAEDEEPGRAREQLRSFFKMAIGAALDAAKPTRESNEEALERRRAAFDRWRNTRRAEILAGEAPVKLLAGVKLLVQLASAQSLDGAIKIDPVVAGKSQALNEMTAPFGVGGFSWAPDIDSFSVFPGADHNAAFGFSRLFDNGVVEYASSFVSGPAPILNSIVLARDISHRLVEVPRKLEIEGPYFLSIDVVGTKGGVFNTQGHLIRERGRPVSVDTLSPGVIVIDHDTNLDAALQSAFDHCWRAGGFENCFIRRDGSRR